ncbi:PhzF family phenazine biosynthesis protein [Agaribacterium sp. ZY112]|uniref:PhzF family phenazine biosynthesis protein n=1 Tax=Agaribacterium sp. ZY112 TaxID=3233574 RepID=UPI0035260082
MSANYLVVDAFSDSVFGGVPVAVFTDAGDISSGQCQHLAEEIMPSDTVFIDSAEASSGCYGFRFFNAQGSCGAGGHTIIAGLAALKHVHGAGAGAKLEQVKIDAGDSSFEAAIDTGEHKYPFLWRQSLSPEFDHFVPDIADLARIIRVNPDDVNTTSYQCFIAACGLPYLIIALKSYEALRAAELNTTAWAESSLPEALVDRILLHVPSTGGLAADFHARLLRRGDAAHADPAIGEAMPAFAAYLCEHEQVPQGTHSLTVMRGELNKRQSFIHLDVEKGESGALSLRTAGDAVVSASGEIVNI